jgi:hypothetical protein
VQSLFAIHLGNDDIDAIGRVLDRLVPAEPWPDDDAIDAVTVVNPSSHRR